MLALVPPESGLQSLQTIHEVYIIPGVDPVDPRAPDVHKVVFAEPAEL